MTDPDTFDPAKVADIVRGHIPAPRRTAVEEAQAAADFMAARDEARATRAEELHALRITRAQEADDYRKAEAKRLAAETPDEIAARARGRR